MRRAFTLIELLVVIAIIAILAAILFPVFASVKAAAQSSVNMSNMRQIATAARLYALDTDGLSPTKNNLGGALIRSVDDPYSIATVLRSYTKSDEVWFWSNGKPSLKRYGMGYIWNLNSSNNAGLDVDLSSLGASSTVLAYEAFNFKAPSFGAVESVASGELVIKPQTTHVLESDADRQMHCTAKGGNAYYQVYVDGHIGTLAAAKCKYR